MQSLTLQKLRLVIIASILSFACNFQYGFSTTYMNAPVDVFRSYLNESAQHRGYSFDEKTYDWMWDIIANVWFIGFFFGIWLSPVLNDRYGRKVGFITTNCINLLASILRFFAIIWYCPELLLFARFLASLATAVTYQSLVLFLQECSPTRLRGFLSFTSEIGYSSMTLLGMFLGMESIWGRDLRVLIGSAIPPCILAVLVLWPMHETPKFLFIIRNDKQGAIDSIRFYQGPDANIESILYEMTQEVDSSKQQSSSLYEIFTTPYLRKAVILGCLALQNTVALWAILLSSTYFLRHVSLDVNIAEWSSTAMALCYFIGTFIGCGSIDRFGRRIMILIFTTANTSLLLIYVIFSQLYTVIPVLKYGCLLCFLLYGFTYGVGIGPIPWFISSELVPQRHRSLVQSTCYAINSIMVVILTFSILPLFHTIGSFAFLILYAIPSFFAIIILYLHLPETKGREIHDIVDDLRGNQPSLQTSIGHICA